VVNFKDQSRYLEGTETVELFVADSEPVVEVEYALFGELNKEDVRYLGTLGIEGVSASIKLDDAQLGGAKPIQGSRIDRDDETQWRVANIRYTHVTGVHLCYCRKIETS